MAFSNVLVREVKRMGGIGGRLTDAGKDQAESVARALDKAAVVAGTPGVPAPPIARPGQFAARIVDKGVGEGIGVYHRSMVVSVPLPGQRYGETAVVGVLFPFEPNDGSHVFAFAATDERLRDPYILRAKDFRMDFREGRLVPRGPIVREHTPWFWDPADRIRVPSQTSPPVYAVAYASPAGEVGLTVRYVNDGQTIEERVFVRPEVYADIVASDGNFRLAYATAAALPDAPAKRPVFPPLVLVTPYAASSESGVLTQVGKILGPYAEPYATSGLTTIARATTGRHLTASAGGHLIVTAEPYRMYLPRGDQ